MNPFHVILSLYNYWILFHCEVIFELRFPAVIPLGEEKKKQYLYGPPHWFWWSLGRHGVVILKNATKRSHAKQQSSHRFILRGEKRSRESGRVGGRDQFLKTRVAEEKERGSKRERERGRKRKWEGDGRWPGPPFKRERGECAQAVLLVSAAEDVSVRTTPPVYSNYFPQKFPRGPFPPTRGCVFNLACCNLTWLGFLRRPRAGVRKIS